jgi:putative transposase
MKSSMIYQEAQKAILEDRDFLKTMTQRCLQGILEQEFVNHIGAETYERSYSRQGYRNGYYKREYKTRVGCIELSIPRDREGNFSTDLFSRFQRSEKALCLTLAEMYLQGVSTRKVSAIVEELCGHSISKSQVSELVTSLDSDLENWRTRELHKKYKYLLLDALYEKVREGGKVVSKANMVAIGIDENGHREVIGCCTSNGESGSQWEDFLRDLKHRGLLELELVASDDHEGLVKTIQKCFPGACWQRCQVHYSRNFLSKVRRGDYGKYQGLLKMLFESESKEEALEVKEKLIKALDQGGRRDVADWIDETIEDTLSVYAIPKKHRKRMRSTNMLERLNEEIRRRTRVVRIFPNSKSAERLLTAICQEKSEQWENTVYLNMESQE